MVTTRFPAFLLPEPDFYPARTLAGHPAAAVADELRSRGVQRAFAISTTAGQTRAGQRTLAALNLAGLSRIVAVGAGLIAAMGVAVLGAFMVLERRREFALLRAVGADTTQLLTSPAEEGAIAALGSVLVGVPVGVALGALAVRVLQLFFTLPPPVATVPAGTLAALVVGVAAASALALGAALVSVTRVTAARCGSLTAQPPP